MPKTKEQKQDSVKELQEALETQQSMVFVNYSGLGVKEISAFRRQLREQGARLLVTKKTLLDRVFKEKGIEINAKGLAGQLATVFSFEDPIAGIKTTDTFQKEHQNVEILGGYFENKEIDIAGITQIAKLPGKQELLGQLVGTLAAPISGFATVLQGNTKGLLVALTAIGEKK